MRPEKQTSNRKGQTSDSGAPGPHAAEAEPQARPGTQMAGSSGRPGAPSKEQSPRQGQGPRRPGAPGAPGPRAIEAESRPGGKHCWGSVVARSPVAPTTLERKLGPSWGEHPGTKAHGGRCAAAAAAKGTMQEDGRNEGRHGPDDIAACGGGLRPPIRTY